MVGRCGRLGDHFACPAFSGFAVRATGQAAISFRGKPIGRRPAGSVDPGQFYDLAGHQTARRSLPRMEF